MSKFVPSDACFRKSSFCQTISCVAVAITDDAVFVRDAKDAASVTLTFTRFEWQAFVAGVKKDEFDV